MQNVTMPAAHHDHIQLKQNLNRRKGSHDRLVKSYEKLRQAMQELIDTSRAPNGADIPAPIVQENLWELDVDDDLWADLTRHGAFQDKDAPKWLTDQPTKQGIRAMLELDRCKEELERLDHERGVMYRWLQLQKEQLHLASGLATAQGESYDTFYYLVLISGKFR